ncbi:MAG: OsmC family protein [Magnetospiraceae bacterium]
MATEAHLKWVDHMSFIGETGSGHAVVLDAKPEFGGRNLGPSPMELVLVGAGGCTAIDVVSILKKARQKVEGVEVFLQGERAETVPKVFTKINLHFVVTGHGVKESAVERAVKLSAEKYCSATAMLEKSAEITHSFEVREADH